MEEALKACESVFKTKNRERNHYSDLFFNTCYYHAAVIKYRQGELFEANKYFEDFFKLMETFCKEILSKEDYEKLEGQKVFYQKSDIKENFKNSLKIFASIYWKDYEFTKYYVEKNLDLLS